MRRSNPETISLAVDETAATASAISAIRRLLVLTVAAVIATDVAWDIACHFDIDLVAYAKLALLSVGLAAVGHYYERVRFSAQIGAMLFGCAFLIAFSAAFSVFNYFLLTVAGSRIDLTLARIDLAMGVDWPQLITFIAKHPLANLVLHICYISLLPQIAVLTICLGWLGRVLETYKLLLALAVGAILTVTFWAFLPSFGAFSVYHLDPGLSSRLNLELDTRYARDLVHLLSNGPARIAPDEVKGLVGFPSFHAAMAIFAFWYSRSLRSLRWPFFAINAGVLVSTPIHGGHHVVDVIGGLAVAGAAIVATNLATVFASRKSDLARMDDMLRMPGPSRSPAEISAATAVTTV